MFSFITLFILLYLQGWKFSWSKDCLLCFLCLLCLSPQFALFHWSYHSSYAQPMAKMGRMGPMLNFMRKGNQNQGSSLQQKWWVLSRKANRDQKLPRGRLSRLRYLHYSFFSESNHYLALSITHSCCWDLLMWLRRMKIPTQYNLLKFLIFLSTAGTS